MRSILNRKEKLTRLRKVLSGMGSCLVAYSGGLDSTFLLKIASEEIGDKAVAVTVKSEIFHSNEFDTAKTIAKEFGLKHFFLNINMLAEEDFIKNPKERCYFCKKKLFSRIVKMAQDLKLNFVVDGSIYDDLNDYRPGIKAIRELKVKSPLLESFLSKNDIRILSKEMGLSTWFKPSNACLATRIPYGDKITLKKLKAIERAEEFLRNLGIRQVRVRCYQNNLAKIEVEKKDFHFFSKESTRNKIVSKLGQLGFITTCFDLQEYRTGSMNEYLKEKIEGK